MIKKIIINIFLVAVIVLAFDFAFGKILRHYYFKETSGLHYRTTYSMDSTTQDILIFGASRANHHYVPRVFEDSLKLSYYNTGRDGNGIFFQTAVLRSILKRYTPRMIILDYHGSFDKSELDYNRLSSLLPYYRSHKEIRKEVGLRGPFEKIKLLSESYPFNSQLLTIAMGNMEGNKRRDADDKGYIPMYTNFPPELRTFTSVEMYEVDSNKVNAFREFIALAKASGSRVFVIYSPVYVKVAINQDIDICSEICRRENVPFWDFSEDPFFLSRQDLFYDWVHLNHEGAVLFSKIIASKIKSTL